MIIKNTHQYFLTWAGPAPPCSALLYTAHLAQHPSTGIPHWGLGTNTQLENTCALGWLSLCDPFWGIRQSGLGRKGSGISQSLSTIRLVYTRLEVSRFPSTSKVPPDTQCQAPLRRGTINPRHFAWNLSIVVWIVPPRQSICWSPNSQYLRMWLYLDTGSLKRWLS